MMRKEKRAAVCDPELLPRRYQEEIFSRARESNVIAALDTGSGKTFISTLLMKWVASQEHLRGKAIIFLVPKITLVEQQGDFIAKHTPLRVLKLHGNLSFSMADIVGWKKVFKHHDIFVMTAQIFLDLLTHSHWSISKVSLLVFDECHHARKRHAFNSIMHEYFHTRSDQRPRIFGMTASPIWDPDNPAASLAKLEENLDAKVIAVQVHADELLAHSPKPAELVKKYPPPPTAYDYPSPSLRMCLDMFYPWSDLEIPWSNIQTRYTATSDNLGPYGAELYLYSEMKRRISALIDGLPSDAQRTRFPGVDRTQEVTPIDHLATALLEIEAILSEFRLFFEDDSVPTNLPIPVSLEWCSPKVRALVDVLVEHHSPTFQGIVFVEQRQVAACLAQILPSIPKIKNLIICAELVGQGNRDDGPSRRTWLPCQHDAVKLFREKKINLLIATSVAEEGLDFPACDIVVRFDSLQHIVGYVQSRGRARNKASSFIVMVQEDDTVNLSRYQAFVESEPVLDRIRQSRQVELPNTRVDDDQNEDDDDPADLEERERYVVASTGAVLTYDSAINLLNNLCSLIPCDEFTPALVPKYSGDYEATVQLPSNLPLLSADLAYSGPRKHSKKEAKRAVAFLAVKALHALNVFDDHLLPVSSSRSESYADADGRPIFDVTHIPEIMDVSVRDPWGLVDQKLWLHLISIDGCCASGIVTGMMLPHAELSCDGSVIRVHGGRPLILDDEWSQREIFREFTKRGIWYCNTTRPLSAPPSFYLIPLLPDHRPDFEEMKQVIDNPFGMRDWSVIGEDDYGHLMIMNDNEFSRPLLLRDIRDDISLLSAPPADSQEASFPTYREYFVDKWTGKNWEARVPPDGPLVEVQRLHRCSSGKYSLLGSSRDDGTTDTILVPQGSCRWIAISEAMRRAFRILPSLCHRITDVYRARQARFELGLPPILDGLLVEAFTLPAASAGFNNQRLETLGDSVLKLCTTVHLFNKYPHRHEGQLSHMRQTCISNRTLLSRAKDIGLEHFLTSEGQSVLSWRYTEPQLNESLPEPRATRYAQRQFARRSLQDCMEATLGASFLTGGIPMALRTGGTLGLAFGGPHPWSLRYERPPEAFPAPLFEVLQATLGYTFRCGSLLVEAVTHPSFTTSSLELSYQRLEFLGDALIDLVVLKYVFDKYPEATSEELSVMRIGAVCAAALAFVAVKRLELHKVMLVNSVELSLAISQCAPHLEATTGKDIVENGWRYDTPKPISDVLESVLGAVLVDSGYDLEKASTVVESVMQDVLASLSPSSCRNPIVRLLEWSAALGCREISFRKSASRLQSQRNDSITIVVHGTVVAGPAVAGSLSVAKAIASEIALAVLKDDNSDKCLSRLCDCGKAMDVDIPNDIAKDVVVGGNKEGDVNPVEVQTTKEREV